MRILLSLSVAVLTGLLMTRVAKPLKLPSVTAYLVAGVLIGPYCLGLRGFRGSASRLWRMLRACL